MQPEIDAQLSNFFEDAPARDFAKVMRGYDQHQVDEYLKQNDLEIRQHREQVSALQQELTEAHRQLREQERPTYAGLAHLEVVLSEVLIDLVLVIPAHHFGEVAGRCVLEEIAELSVDFRLHVA